MQSQLLEVKPQVKFDPEENLVIYKVYENEMNNAKITVYNDHKTREKLAKKVFLSQESFYQEKKNLEKVSKQIYDEIAMNVQKYDEDRNTIHFKTGNCTLEDLILKRREQNIYWFDNEEDLHYIINTLFDFVMKMSQQKTYHSNIEPKNIVFLEKFDELESYQIKLAQIGNATFKHTDKTSTNDMYFPDENKFQSYSSEQNRLKAEFYQIGRVLQEICLSSIYSKQCFFYFRGPLNTYEKFIHQYMQNMEEIKQQSMNLIQNYYSENIYNTLKTLLDYKFGAKDCQDLIAKNKNLVKQQYYQDKPELIKRIESSQIFYMQKQQGFEKLENFERVMNYYLQNDYDDLGLKLARNIIKNEYGTADAKKFPLLAIYESIFASKMRETNNSRLIYALERGDFVKQTESIFKDEKVSESLKLLFFLYVISTTDQDKQFDKDRVTKIMDMLGQDSSYDPAFSKYYKFFTKGSAQIFNDTLVEKCQKDFNQIPDELIQDLEKSKLIKNFQLQLKLLFINACYNQMDESIEKGYKILEHIQESEKISQEIKGTKFTKDMQFILVAKAMYFYEKYKKAGKEDKAELNKIIDILKQSEQCIKKAGSPVPKFERKLYNLLAVVNNELKNYDKAQQYDYIRQRLSFDTDKGNLINNSSLDWVKDSGEDDDKKDAFKQQIVENYYNYTGKWFGYDLIEKQIFYILRSELYEKYTRRGDFQHSLQRQRSQLEYLLKFIKMNNSNTTLDYIPPFNYNHYDEQLEGKLCQWIGEMIKAEEQNDNDFSSKKLNEIEKKYSLDLFSSDFKLFYINFNIYHDMREHKKAYEYLDYMKDKYVDYPKVLNDIQISEIFLSIVSGNKKKISQAKGEVTEEDLTSIQKHSIELLEDLAVEFSKPYQPPEKFQQQQYIQKGKEWCCPHCESELQFFPHDGDYQQYEELEIECQHCSKSMNQPETLFIEPAYGCKCQKKDFHERYRYQYIVTDTGEVEQKQYDVLTYQHYYICQTCYLRPKLLQCRKCSKPLQRGNNIYQNDHLIDESNGFCCRIRSQNCKEVKGMVMPRIQADCYYCPDCVLTDEEIYSEAQYHLKPHERKFVTCVPCSQIWYDSFYQEKYREFLSRNPNPEFSQKEAQLNEQIELKKKICYEKKDVFHCQNGRNYKGYDFKLVYQLIESHGLEWEHEYKEVKGINKAKREAEEKRKREEEEKKRLKEQRRLERIEAQRKKDQCCIIF